MVRNTADGQGFNGKLCGMLKECGEKQGKLRTIYKDCINIHISLTIA